MILPCRFPLGVLGAAAAAMILAAAPALAQPPDMPPAPVVTELVEEGSIAQSVRLSGNVEPLFTSRIRAEQPGIIERLHVDVGDYVTTGSALLELRRLPLELELARARAEADRLRARLEELESGSRSEDVRISRAAVEEKEAALELARMEFERYSQLISEGSVSQSEFDTRRGAYLVAQAELNSARAQLEKDEAGERAEIVAAARADHAAARARLDLARDQLDRAIVRAPFAGTISGRHVGPGEWLSVGDDIVELDYVDEVKVRIDIPETYFPTVPMGSVFKLTFEAYPQDVFEGFVYQRVLRADPRTRSLPVNIVVENGERLIAPGMLARARLEAALEGEKSMLVARDALVPGEGGVHVVRVHLDNEGNATSEIIPVTTGRFFGQYVEVFGELSPNEQVVVRGNERLQPGQPLSLNQFITNPDASRILDPSLFFNERR